MLNPWKHHAAFLRDRIRLAVAAGPAALDELARGLVVVGTELMDLYHGGLSPVEIGAGILDLLRRDGRLSPDAYGAWVEANRGYQVLTLPADGSQWVLRRGDDAGRWVHVHPARYAPQTCRVKATALKTAVMALAYAGVHGGDPLDVAVVNRARGDHLGLPPLGRELAIDQGIGQAIELLRGVHGE